MNKKFICIICPVGCEIEVEYDSEKIKKITGNSCEKGKEYIVEEIYNPKRVLTTTVKIKNGEMPLVSVKTSKPIPKDLIFKSMDELAEIKVSAPIKIGDIIIKNLLNTGADVIATKKVDLKFKV